MENNTLDVTDIKRSVLDAVSRVDDNEHSREDVELLAVFAEGVLLNLTDSELQKALKKRKALDTKETSAQAAADAVKVFGACGQRPPHQIGPPTKFVAKLLEKTVKVRRSPAGNRLTTRKEALELAYWVFYATSESVGNGARGQLSVSRSGPTHHQIQTWLDGDREAPPPLATRLVQYRKMKETVFAALNKFGFEVDKLEADQFKSGRAVRQSKTGSG